jgi:hypothetical protein
MLKRDKEEGEEEMMNLLESGIHSEDNPFIMFRCFFFFFNYYRIRIL